MTVRQPTSTDQVADATSGIAKPELSRYGLGYVAHVRTEGARVLIENIQRQRGGLVADLTVAIGPIGAQATFTTVTSGRLDLSSISQRESWERRLGRIDGDPKKWGRVMDGVCAAVLRAERRVDAPGMYLRDAVTPPAGTMALPPLVLANLNTLWFGADGTLKSYAALAAVLSLHTGMQFLGMQPSASKRSAFCNFEPFDAGEHLVRMRRLLGVEIDAPTTDLPDLVYVDCYGSTLVEQVERIQRVVRDERIQFIALDSIGFAADGPLNDDETARRFWHAVGQIGVPLLATAHTPKAGDEVFGSRFWRAGARLAWHLSKFDSGRPGGVSLRFACQKSSVDLLPKPMGLFFEFAHGNVRISCAVPEREVESPLHERIAQVLRASESGFASYPELALQLGSQENAVRRAVAEHLHLFTVLDPLDGGGRKRVALRSEAPE